MSREYSEPEPMPEEVEVPDGEFDVDQDPRWFMDDLYSYRVWGDDGDSG